MATQPNNDSPNTSDTPPTHASRFWRSPLILPVILIALAMPVALVALLTFDSGGACNCNCGSAYTAQPHSHGAGIARTEIDGVQLILNVSPSTALYEIVDGELQICGGAVDGDMKHVTVDVNDAQLVLGERLPVTVELEIREAGSERVVVRAAAPAMYAPGHGYHFGDNYRLPDDQDYEYTVTVSPVAALRQEGAQDLWLEPVVWDGAFSLDAEGRTGAAAKVNVIGDVLSEGLHLTLGHQPAQALYRVEGGSTQPQQIAPNSVYFVLDVTDHAVNIEEKLPGAQVTLSFTQGRTQFSVPLEPVISPDYGFHYGANVPLAPGEWTIQVRIEPLSFWRHAGAASNLGRRPVTAEFTFAYDPPDADTAAAVVEQGPTSQ